MSPDIQKVKLIKDGIALVDSGPLFATVLVSRNNQPMSEEAMSGAYYALDILKQLVDYLSVIRQKINMLQNEPFYPLVIQKMISAAKCINDANFTPLAAVAGATADMVADYLTDSGATKIIVDNGGDIAVRLKDGDSATIGLCLNSNTRAIEHYISVYEDCGICTSGAYGRSFSLGIADAATALAKSSAIADAAATYLGNKTNIDSKKITRRLAEEIDPDTDIPGMYVTTSIGELSSAEIRAAMNNAKEAALKLIEENIIEGALISIKSDIVCLGKLQQIEDNLKDKITS
jgi:ApbE superfamily uncharacterized protein (UPF0280 family)